jgi:hypothetical protein
MAAAKMSPAEMKAAEEALLAEEQATKRKWCRLKGHMWNLPADNPFNQSATLTECEVICGRCNAHAKVTVTVIEGT